MLEHGSRVLVVIVNFNSGALLCDAIIGVHKQTYRSWKLVVVDNASTDGSADRLEKIFPGIQVIRSQNNVGFAAANNLAVRTAQNADWIALLNPDAVPHPRWLEELMTAARSYAGFGSFASRLLASGDRRILDGVGDVYHVSGRYWRRGYGSAAAGFLQASEAFSPCAAAALYRADLFREIGGFDESFFCYAEDIDLGFRLRLAGYRCLYVPEAVAYHVGSATTGGQHSDFSVYHGHRNLVWTYVKNMPWPLFCLYLPQHILLNLISLVWFSLRGQTRVIFKAKWDAVKELPRILRERKKIQSKRYVSAWELRRAMAKGLFRPYIRHRM
ncbi:MAG: glycosyltransferase family 2 protein [Patescibacteria group bacterium]